MSRKWIPRERKYLILSYNEDTSFSRSSKLFYSFPPQHHKLTLPFITIKSISLKNSELQQSCKASEKNTQYEVVCNCRSINRMWRTCVQLTYILAFHEIYQELQINIIIHVKREKYHPSYIWNKIDSAAETSCKRN